MIYGFAVMKSNSLKPNEITTISFLSEGEDSHEVLPSECAKKRGGRFFLKTKTEDKIVFHFNYAYLPFSSILLNPEFSWLCSFFIDAGSSLYFRSIYSL